MQTDTIKLVFTYAIAAFIVVGGLVFLFVTRTDTGADSTRLLVGGFMGSAITFVFGQESAKAATRAAQSSAASGAEQALATPPTPAP
jgi:class 3 adenylate cyclase